MRFRGSLPLLGASLLLLGAQPALSEESTARKPAARACSRPEVPPLPSQPTERDRHDQNLRHRLRSRECEIEARRRAEPEGSDSCYFGPELVRISNARYEEIWQEHKHDRAELWHAFLSEPEDPNLPPIEVRVMSKSGTSCKPDYDRQLHDEVEALLKQLNIR